MNKADMPLISVIMGVRYCREDLSMLKRSVQSILNQTYSNFEFLICDDGSSENAMSLLNQTAQEDMRIQLIRSGAKLDLASKLNACLREAKGSYIARMDDDDFSHPDRFEKQLAVLETNLMIAFVGCNVLLCKNGMVCGERVFPEFPMVKNFYMTQPFIHPTLMFRKEVLEKVGGYSEDKQQILCEDYDLLLRIYSAGYCGVNLQENLFDYTVPYSEKGNRKMKHRWNETVTRWNRFKELRLLPKALPYVVKPLVVGLLPECILRKIKKRQ